MNTQVTPLFRLNRLTSEFDSSTRGERQFLKFFRNHTMLTTPQRSAHLVVQSQFLKTMVGPQLLNTIVGTQLYGRELHSLPQWRKLNCLPAWSNVNLQLILFQNLQILRTIASGHEATQASFPIWCLLRQLWLSYPLHASVNYNQCLCTWTKSRIVQSLNKLNDKI